MKLTLYKCLPIILTVALFCTVQTQAADADSLIIYSCSFEVPDDTTNWTGLGSWMLVDDPAPGQGTRSLLIGGGCLQPAAWIDIPCTTGDGRYRLSFWGHAGDVTPWGGCVVFGPADWSSPSREMIEICMDSLDWTFYQADMDLQLGGIDTLRIQLLVGGYVFDDMQIDGLEIVKRTTLGSGSVEPRPAVFYLVPVFPNPFNPSTTIRWRQSLGTNVSVTIHDLRGGEVVRLLDEFRPAGEWVTVWDAGDMPSGVYIARLRAGDFTASTKLVLLTRPPYLYQI